MGNNGSYADAAAFRAAAPTGRIGIDPDPAQTVLNKIRTGKDAVEGLLFHSGSLAAAPKIGANPVGAAIAAKYSGRADGHEDSYSAALRNLYNQYEQAEQAIVTAMSRYNEIDQAGIDPLRGRP
ncbi:hypothetical protein ABZ639_18025 [Saccharomonospora sp. NPDC006951]